MTDGEDMLVLEGEIERLEAKCASMEGVVTAARRVASWDWGFCTDDKELLMLLRVMAKRVTAYDATLTGTDDD